MDPDAQQEAPITDAEAARLSDGLLHPQSTPRAASKSLQNPRPRRVLPGMLIGWRAVGAHAISGPIGVLSRLYARARTLRLVQVRRSLRRLLVAIKEGR